MGGCGRGTRNGQFEVDDDSKVSERTSDQISWLRAGAAFAEVHCQSLLCNVTDASFSDLFIPALTAFLFRLS